MFLFKMVCLLFPLVLVLALVAVIVLVFVLLLLLLVLVLVLILLVVVVVVVVAVVHTFFICILTCLPQCFANFLRSIEVLHLTSQEFLQLPDAGHFDIVVQEISATPKNRFLKVDLYNWMISNLYFGNGCFTISTHSKVVV